MVKTNKKLPERYGNVGRDLDPQEMAEYIYLDLKSSMKSKISESFPIDFHGTEKEFQDFFNGLSNAVIPLGEKDNLKAIVFLCRDFKQEQQQELLETALKTGKELFNPKYRIYVQLRKI